MKCQNCGTEVQPNSHYCPTCGKNTTLKVLEAKDAEFLLNSSFSGVIFEDNPDFLKILGEGEEVLFQTYYKGSIIEDAMGDIQVGSIFSFVILFTFFLFFFPSLPKADLFIAVLFTVGFLGMFLIALYPLIKGLRNYKKIKRYTGLTHKELKKYLTAILITNNRYIEKSYKEDSVDFFGYPSDIVKQERDFLFIRLRFIYLRYSKTDVYNLISIEVYLEPFEDVNQTSNLNVIFIQLNEFENLLKKFEDQLHINVERSGGGSGIIRFINKV